MQLWPAIDLYHGRAVRLHQGDYDKVTVYHADPVAHAASWRGVAKHLHVVDLRARAGKPARPSSCAGSCRLSARGRSGGGVRDRGTIGRTSSSARAGRARHGRHPRSGARARSGVGASAAHRPRAGRQRWSRRDGRLACRFDAPRDRRRARPRRASPRGHPLYGYLARRHAHRTERGGDGAARRGRRTSGARLGGVATLDDLRRLAGCPGTPRHRGARSTRIHARRRGCRRSGTPWSVLAPDRSSGSHPPTQAPDRTGKTPFNEAGKARASRLWLSERS